MSLCTCMYVHTYMHACKYVCMHAYIIYIDDTYILTHIIIQYRTHTTGIRVCLHAQTYIDECRGAQHVASCSALSCWIMPLCRCFMLFYVVLCCSFLGSRHDRSYVLRLTVVIGTFETMATARPRLPSAVRHSTSWMLCCGWSDDATGNKV